MQCNVMYVCVYAESMEAFVKVLVNPLVFGDHRGEKCRTTTMYIYIYIVYVCVCDPSPPDFMLQISSCRALRGFPVFGSNHIQLPGRTAWQLIGKLKA